MSEPTQDHLRIADEVIASHLPPGHRRDALKIRVARALAAEQERALRQAWGDEKKTDEQ